MDCFNLKVEIRFTPRGNTSQSFVSGNALEHAAQGCGGVIVLGGMQKTWRCGPEADSLVGTVGMAHLDAHLCSLLSLPWQGVSTR